LSKVTSSRFRQLILVEAAMLALELPHWLIVAGSALVMAGLIGLGLTRNKQAEGDPVALPGDLMEI
jgi:hypothetical protein